MLLQGESTKKEGRDDELHGEGSAVFGAEQKRLRQSQRRRHGRPGRGGLAGCAPNKVEPAKKDEAADARNITDGTWVTAACWHNCGGRCLNKALVKDGVVIRQKTDDTHEDSPDYPQQRACVRGRAQRNHVLLSLIHI